MPSVEVRVRSSVPSEFSIIEVVHEGVGEEFFDLQLYAPLVIFNPVGMRTACIVHHLNQIRFLSDPGLDGVTSLKFTSNFSGAKQDLQKDPEKYNELVQYHNDSTGYDNFGREFLLEPDDDGHDKQMTLDDDDEEDTYDTSLNNTKLVNPELKERMSCSCLL